MRRRKDGRGCSFLGLQRRVEACCPHPARAAREALSPQTCRTGPIARGSADALKAPEPL